MSLQYRQSKVYKLQLKNIIDTRKRVSTQADENKLKNLPTENYQIVSNQWRLSRKVINSNRNQRLSTQYPDSESDAVYPPVYSPRQPIRSRRAISQKRNASLSNYQSNSPKYQNPSTNRQLFTSNKLTRQPNITTKILNITNILSASEMKTFMQKWELTQEEWDRFANRFPQTFTREKLLGRGGFSLIWLGKNIQTGQVFAIKQIPKKSKHETHFKELQFCQIKPIYAQHEGIKQLCKMYDFIIEPQDIFLVYEVCGMSLGTQLYDFETQPNNTYKLLPQKLNSLFRSVPGLLFRFIKKLAQVIELISKSGWVHSDIKSENILVTYNSNDVDLKLVDFGSSFKFTEVFQKFSMATPEYMCPEMLTFILRENQMTFDAGLLQYLNNYDREYVIDIWGVGCVLLEIISGLPLWMTFDTQVVNLKGQRQIAQGLFAVSGRSFNKIVEKQLKIVSNLDAVLREHNYSGIQTNGLLLYLVKGMLQIDPSKRLSPQQIIEQLENY